MGKKVEYVKQNLRHSEIILYDIVMVGIWHYVWNYKT